MLEVSRRSKANSLTAFWYQYNAPSRTLLFPVPKCLSIGHSGPLSLLQARVLHGHLRVLVEAEPQHTPHSLQFHRVPCMNLICLEDVSRVPVVLLVKPDVNLRHDPDIQHMPALAVTPEIFKKPFLFFHKIVSFADGRCSRVLSPFSHHRSRNGQCPKKGAEYRTWASPVFTGRMSGCRYRARCSMLKVH